MENPQHFYETQDKLRIQRRSHEPGEQFDSALAASFNDMPGNDNSYAFWPGEHIPTRELFHTAYSMQSAHTSTGFGSGHALLHGSASWLQGPPRHAGIDSQQSWIEATNSHHQQLFYTGVTFPQQSWHSNNVYHQPCSASEAIPIALESSIFSPGFNLIQPVVTSQPALSDLSALSLPLPGPSKPVEAVVMERPDGKFFCSQLGCDAVYLRPGDCRRHLKMHNGPFFPCKQPGCDMEFYRRDKLRDHMKQGHNIVVAAPRRGRRVVKLTANQDSGY